MINLKIVIPVVVILILGTVLGLLATETWSPSWNPFRKAPSLAIEEAIAKMARAETFKITGKIEGEFQTEEEAQEAKIVTAVLFLSQIIDKREPENPKTSADLDLRLGMEGVMLQMKGELVSFGKDIYLKITTLPSLPFLGFDLEEVKNQWFKIDVEKLREMTGEEKEEPIDEKALLSDLKNLLIGKEIFKVEKNLGEEELDGVKVKHYLTRVKKETLKVLIPEIFQLMEKYIPEKERITYEKDLETFLENFSENFDETWRNIEPLEIDFWVEKGNLWLRRMKFEKEIGYGSTSTEDIGRFKLGIDLNFSDFNKKFEIEIPKDFKLIEEFLSSSLFLAPEESLPEEYFPSESIPEFEFLPE